MTKQKLIKDVAMRETGGKQMDNYQEYLSEVLTIMSIFGRRYA